MVVTLDTGALRPAHHRITFLPMQSALPAQTSPQPPQSEQKAAKTLRVSKRLAEAVRLILSGECKTQRAAAERVKMNTSHLCEALQKPHVLAFIEQQTRVTLARSQAPAAAALIRLMESAASEHVQKDVAIHLLSIAGHKPASSPQVSVNIDIRAGYVIDLSEPSERPMVDVSPKVLTDRGTGGE